SNVRSLRAEMNVPAGARLSLVVTGAGEETLRRLVADTALITRLARLDDISPRPDVPGESAQFVVGDATFALPLAGVIDLGVEKAGLEKELVKMDGEIAEVDKKLNTEQFDAKAAEEVIEEEKARRAAAVARRKKILEAMQRLR